MKKMTCVSTWYRYHRLESSYIVAGYNASSTILLSSLPPVALAIQDFEFITLAKGQFTWILGIGLIYSMMIKNVNTIIMLCKKCNLQVCKAVAVGKRWGFWWASGIGEVPWVVWGRVLSLLRWGWTKLRLMAGARISGKPPRPLPP